MVACVERMLFLTATPFQLGHHELCSILSRFDGIHWESQRPPQKSRVEYEAGTSSTMRRINPKSFPGNLTTRGRLGNDDWVVDDVRHDDEEAGGWRCKRPLQNAEPTERVGNWHRQRGQGRGRAQTPSLGPSPRETMLANDVPRRSRHSGDLIRLDTGFRHEAMAYRMPRGPGHRRGLSVAVLARRSVRCASPNQARRLRRRACLELPHLQDQPGRSASCGGVARHR